MDIFFSVNNSWAEQLQTAMVSVLENNSWGSIHFHVLTVSLSSEARKGVERLINRYPNCDVDYPIIERSLLEKYHISMEDGFKRSFFPLFYSASVSPTEESFIFRCGFSLPQKFAHIVADGYKRVLLCRRAGFMY